MAHTLRLSYAGSTINLNSGSNVLRYYVPESPNLSTIDTNTILEDGGRRTLTSRRNVTETCTVLIKSTSGSASLLEAAKQKIQEWMLYAERHNETGDGSPVYVEYAPDGLSSSVYRSELLGGKVEIADNSLDTRWTQNRAVELDLIWSREFFWEGDEVTLSLFNSGCTSTCSTIYNRNPLDYTGQSGCYNNWVQIAGSAVKGEIPTPAFIEIHNQWGSIAGPTFHVFHGHNSSITSFLTTLEVEEGGGGWAAGGSSHSSASYSDGASYEFGIANSKLEAVEGYSAIPSGSLQKYNGGYYNIMGAFVDLPSASIFVKMKLSDDEYAGLITITEGPRIELDTTDELQTLGTMQIPPVRALESTHGQLRLNFVSMNYSGASTTLNMDCMYIMPLDGYRRISRSQAWAINDKIVDDGYKDTMYEIRASNGSLYPYVKWRGRPIMLMPNKNQRIYFLMSRFGTYDTNYKFGAKVKYRPRRLTI